MTVKIGGHVTWHDEYGKPHDALVTNVHGPLPHPAINVVVVNMDEGQTDTYGQKVQRETSVVHESSQYAHGRYWTEDEAKA